MHLGVDVSTPVNAAAAACMKAQHQIDFAISRAWFSDGEGFDHSAVESGASFRAANITSDVYMFPCSFGLSAASQVEQLMGNLSAHGVQFGMVWFDVESNPDPKCAWSANKTRNCEFMGELVRAAEGTNAIWGVYSSIHMWTEWMTDAGSPGGCTVASAAGMPLWYCVPSAKPRSAAPNECALTSPPHRQVPALRDAAEPNVQRFHALRWLDKTCNQAVRFAQRAGAAACVSRSARALSLAPSASTFLTRTPPSLSLPVRFGDGDVPPGDLCGISVDNNVAPV